MNTKTCFLLTILLVIATASSISLAARPDASGSAQPKHSTKGKPSNNQNNNKDGGGGYVDPGMGGFFGGPGGNGFNIPGFGSGSGIIGGGYGAGYGGPTGGYGKGGVVRPTVVCKDKGPCHNKKLTCPAKCFTSYSRSGKGYGGGGGGGGCTMDCKKKCVAYC